MHEAEKGNLPPESKWMHTVRRYRSGKESRPL